MKQKADLVQGWMRKGRSDMLAMAVEPLTPYAVELRYDHEFWPGPDAAEKACSAAAAVKDFVSARL